MNQDPPTTPNPGQPDGEYVEVKAHIAYYEVDGDIQAEGLHKAFESINEGFDWDADPAVALLLAPDSGEGDQLVVVAVLEVLKDGVVPHRLLPDSARNLFDQVNEKRPGYHVVAVSYFAEAWGYTMEGLSPEEIAAVVADDQAWADYSKTVARYESKTISTIEVESGDFINSMMVKDRQETFSRVGLPSDTEVPTVLEAIAQQFRDQST